VRRKEGRVLAGVLEGGTIRLGDQVDFVDDEVVAPAG
jgi:MOSC domain-containing protein YiiM